MKKNPKTIAGLAGMTVLLVALLFMVVKLVPVVREVQREMSLTPTPLPPVPANVMAVTPDPSLPTAAPVMRTGSKGQEVKDLQTRLSALGFYSGKIDGEFGPGTKEAVTAFQKANGLEADGIVGEETRELLFSVNAKPSGN
jgi:peptidoglycan hydrolase-like protein with peptidoglycan-binding domain